MGPAQAGGETQPQSLLGMAPMIIAMFAIFYFVLIRPQQKQMKAHQALINGLQKGAEVVTSAGIYGRITNISDDTVTLQVADNVKIKFTKSSIQQVVSAEGSDKKGD
jgi:preprotein translocase subunit YajC